MRIGTISRALVLGAATVASAAAQDDCVSATPLVVGANPYSTIGATLSVEPWNCASSTAPDLWYTYAPSVAGALVTIETCVGTFYDSALSVYTGACGALTLVQCNDDNCGLQSGVQFIADGGLYYVRVGGFGANVGAGVLTVTDIPAPNDECAAPIALALGANPFNNLAATSSIEPWCGAINGGSDKWYTYTSTGAGNTIGVNTCGSGFDTVLEVYTGGCGALASVACNDDATIVCAGSLQSAVSFVSPAAGTVYLVRVGGFFGVTGSGAINVSDVAPPPTLDLAFTDCLPGTFIDISGTGAALNLADDAEIDIPMTVSNALFAMGTARVGSNGAVRFAGAGADLGFTNETIPSAAAFSTTSQVLMPLWDDFNTLSGTAGNIYWEVVSGTLIVQWQNAQFFSSTERATFQLQVPSTGPALAQFIYTDIESLRATGGSSATIGYQAGGIANNAMHSFNAHHAVRNGTVLSLVNRLAATTYMTNTVPGTWIDISGTGTALNLADDGEVNITTTIGNALLAAGTARVGSNGGVRFGGPGLELGITNGAIPASGAFGLTSQSLLAFWDDFDTEGGLWGNIYWQEIGDTLIIQWANAAFFNGSALQDRATFQIQVFKGGPVVAQFLYQDIQSLRAGGGTSATIGYQAGGIAGNNVQWSFNTAASVANGTVLSICYTDAVVGTRYCIPVANSTGSPANMYGTGSASLAANNLVLNVTDLPANSFGFFLRGTATANTLLSGGGLGTLCVGGTVARGVGLAIVNSGAEGMVSLPALLTTLPTGGPTVSATVGQVLWLQYWYRDFVGASTSNLSNALQVRVTM